ncbi:MAG TPA: carboxymuconolactone decarboxylase family protein [Gemmatimonadaceae bacterium]|nr:carboxymuconolactone decarboxylase family protein [Gemmatimonadaceae bacterium]
MQDTTMTTTAPARDGAAATVQPHPPRIDFTRVDPKAYKAMLGLEEYVRSSGLEHSLYELIKIRASYMNGCAYCIDMHTKDARHAGETEQRLYAVPVWRETPFFTARERAALAWAEALTDIARTGAPDDVYEEVRAHFDEQELVALTLAVVTINGWNRIAIPFRAPVGSYEPGKRR